MKTIVSLSLSKTILLHVDFTFEMRFDKLSGTNILICDYQKI